MAERRFPVRVSIGVPSGSFGRLHPDMTVWRDENRDADERAMIPS